MDVTFPRLEPATMMESVNAGRDMIVLIMVPESPYSRRMLSDMKRRVELLHGVAPGVLMGWINASDASKNNEHVSLVAPIMDPSANSSFPQVACFKTGSDRG